MPPHKEVVPVAVNLEERWVQLDDGSRHDIAGMLDAEFAETQDADKCRWVSAHVGSGWICFGVDQDS